MGRKHDGVRPLGRGAGWICSVGRTWLGNGLFEGTTGPLMQSLLVLAILWTFYWWL
jgi:hypothetical protein